MAKKVTGTIKPQLPAGKATPAPPVGSALGQHGVNVMGFYKEFSAETVDKAGLIIPVVITVCQDRSFDFILKTPPAVVLIKRELGLENGSSILNRTEAGNITREQIRKIVELKMPDLSAATIEIVVSMIEGTARSMGVVVVEQFIQIGGR